MSLIYATVGDRQDFRINPKTKEREEYTVEGDVVVKDIEVNGSESFKAKYDGIKALWPGASVRFMKERQ